jgi:hypothetical protein
VQELQSQVFTGRVMLDEARRKQRASGEKVVSNATGDAGTTRILQLSRLTLEQTRCRISVTDQWIDVEAFDDDPQLLLPVIRGRGGKVQLRLSCIAEPHEALQIYWATGEEPFSTENMRTVSAESAVVSANLVLDVTEGDLLRIRIDPTTGIGSSRLHGSLGGVFTLAEKVAADEDMVIVKPAAASASKAPSGKPASDAGRVTPRPPRRSAAR